MSKYKWEIKDGRIFLNGNIITINNFFDLKQGFLLLAEENQALHTQNALFSKMLEKHKKVNPLIERHPYKDYPNQIFTKTKSENDMPPIFEAKKQLQEGE